MFEDFEFPRQIFVGIGAAVLTWILWKRFAEPKEKVVKDSVELKKSPDHISAKPNGNLTGTKTKTAENGKDNLAYSGDDPEVKSGVKSENVKIITEQPRLKAAEAYERQVSDVSTLSDFPPPSGKGLTEMVMEEIERSFSNDNTAKELEKSFNRDAEDHVKQNKTPTEEPSSSIIPNTRTADHNFELKDDSNKSSPAMFEKILEEKPETPVKSAIETVDKENVWRNKLIEDLEDDDEFISSSDEETDYEEDEKHSGDENEEGSTSSVDKVTIEKEVNENTRRANTISRENSTKSETVKCGGVPVVLDIGSYEIKAGTAGDYEPAFKFRNVIGKWRPQVGEAYSEAFGDTLYADEALQKHNALSLQYPLQDGNVTDWRNFQNIVDWTLCHRLKVDIKDHPLLIVEPSLRSKSQREKQLEVVMEALHCPMVQFQQQSVLSAQAASNDVALVITSGHSRTEVVPVYYGYSIHHAIQKVNVGGRHITEYLGRLLLKERGINFSSVADHLLLESIKKSYAEIRDDQDPLKTSSKTIQHELPDGEILELGEEIYKCTEPIYKPDLIGDHHGIGLCEAIKNAINSVDDDLQAEMKSTVLITGGNGYLKGFRKSLCDKLYSSDESTNSGKKSKRWHVTECDDLTNSAWLGGSFYADSDEFRDCCITDDMYFECGASIVHRMCA